ncbi:hypothetical protein, partial [Pontimicrobium sp. MEBiC01747]
MFPHKKTLQRYDEIDLVFEKYIDDCQYGKQLSIQTIKSYKEVFRTFRKILPEITTIKDIHPQIFSELFKRLSN